MKRTVPSKRRFCDRYLAAPSSMVECPSCPHACILPSFCERCAKSFSSCKNSASMSARRPMALPPLPFVSVATTPVPARPLQTSSPKPISFSATKSDVRRSSNAVSGCAWRSRRQAVSSSCMSRMSRIASIATVPLSLKRDHDCTQAQGRQANLGRLGVSQSCWPCGGQLEYACRDGRQTRDKRSGGPSSQG